MNGIESYRLDKITTGMNIAREEIKQSITRSSISSQWEFKLLEFRR